MVYEIAENEADTCSRGCKRQWMKRRTPAFVALAVSRNL
jgi:hypothetical protein